MITINIEERLGQIPSRWSNLEPNDFAYGSTTLYNHIVAQHKLADVVLPFSQARYLLIENANQCENNTKMLLFKRATLLQSSMMTYALCIDLSWQAIYFMYVVESDVKLITDINYYEEILRNCNYKKLIKGLKKSKLSSANDVLLHLKTYRDKELWKKIDDTNKYIKHRGRFNITGLEINENRMMFSVNNVVPHLLIRKEFDVDEWTERLIEFNKDFSAYFNKIIDFILLEGSERSATTPMMILNNLSKL